MDYFLNQDFDAFDQSPVGRRSIVADPCVVADTICFYINNTPKEINAGQKALLYFHAGQKYALGGSHTLAISCFGQTLFLCPDVVGFEYISMTLGFLKKDKNLCAEIYAHSTPDTMNHDTIVKLRKNFDKPYSEAYTN